MDTLAYKLSEILDITVEKALELYPLVREQLVFYNTLYFLETMFEIILFLLGIGCVTFFIFYIGFVLDDNSGSDEYADRIRKILVTFLLFFVISIAIYVVINIFLCNLAPDIVLLKEFILK